MTRQLKTEKKSEENLQEIISKESDGTTELQEHQQNYVPQVKEVLTEDYQTEITPEQAVKIANDKLYENWNDEEKVRFQLFTPYLAMPLSVFHEAIENVLGRPVWTHEFARMGELKKEFLGIKKAPTMEEIINLIPKEKRIIVGI